jgi:hypothetical protein
VRFNQDDLDTGLLRLVADHRLQFCETPIVNNLRFPAVSNPGQVFQHDPLIGRLRISDNLLADAMVSAGAVELFHGGLQLFRRFSSSDTPITKVMGFSLR